MFTVILDLIYYSFQVLFFFNFFIKLESIFEMSVCAFNSLLHKEYSNLFIVAAFSSKSFFGKTSCQSEINIY